MAEAMKKYRIIKEDGDIGFIIKSDLDSGESFIMLSKPEIKELIQDLLQCLKHAPSIAGAKDKR